ncbi:ATP-grasp domain-containing protein [Kitasatospora sp. NPDC088783]|uniref:ATP-grasp domain-containing protein n=1 Tax=Kitasatospora sp. NPDC088783 TaxID=3364077 RepID=UPI0037F72A68
MHIVLIETTSVRGFDIVKTLSRAGIEVSFVADDMDFFRGDLGFEDVEYATRVVEVPGLARASDLAERLEGRLGPNPVDGVICRVEDYLEVASRLAATWGLPHDNPAAARLLSDKDAVRRRLAEHGLGTLRWRGVTGSAEGLAAVEEIGLPVVIKPVFGGYSVGVTVARTPQEAGRALHAMFDAPGAAGRKAVVEEFAFGRYVSAEIMVQDGEPLLLGFTEQRAQPPGITAETGRHFPAEFPGMGAAREFALAAVRAAGITNSAVHMELVITPTGPELIEINGRVAGHVVTRLMSLALDRPVFFDLVALATGERLNRVVEPVRSAALRHLWTETAGTVTGITAPEGPLPGLESYELSVAPGSAVLPLRSNWDRIGYLVTTGETGEDACADAEAAAAAVLAGVVVEPTVPAEPPQPVEEAQAGPEDRAPHLLLLLDAAERDGFPVPAGQLLESVGNVTGRVSVVWLGDGAAAIAGTTATATSGGTAEERQSRDFWHRRFNGSWQRAEDTDTVRAAVERIHRTDALTGVLTFSARLLPLARRLQHDLRLPQTAGSSAPYGELPADRSHAVLAVVRAGQCVRLGVLDREVDPEGTETWQFPSTLEQAEQAVLTAAAERVLADRGVTDGIVEVWTPADDPAAVSIRWGLDAAVHDLVDAVRSRSVLESTVTAAIGRPARPLPAGPARHAITRRHTAPSGSRLGHARTWADRTLRHPEMVQARVDTGPDGAPVALTYTVVGTDPADCRQHLARIERGLPKPVPVRERTHVLLLDRVAPEEAFRADGSPLLDPAGYKLTVVAGSSGARTAITDDLVLTDVFEPARLDALVAAFHRVDPFHRIAAIPERLLLPAAGLRDRLGLPGDGRQLVGSFRDKALMKERAARAGIRHAAGGILSDPHQLRAAAAEGVVVVKPRSEAGSRGVSILRDPAAADTWLRESFQPDAYLYEEYVAGRMCHIDALVHAGRTLWDVSLYVSDTLSHTRGEPLSSVTSGDPQLRTAADALLHQVIEGWRVRSAVLHLEAFWDGTELTFCEVAARPGGAGVVPAFELTRGIDLDHAKVLIDVGDDPWTLTTEPGHAFAGWTVHYAADGVLTAYDDGAVAPAAAVRRLNRAVGQPTAAAGFAGSGLSLHVFGGAREEDVRALVATAEAGITFTVEQP